MAKVDVVASLRAAGLTGQTFLGSAPEDGNCDGGDILGGEEADGVEGKLGGLD